jgi:hypothetical protein
MDGEQWVAMIIMMVWASCAVGAIVTRDLSIYIVPAVITIAIGVGYFLIRILGC